MSQASTSSKRWMIKWPRRSAFIAVIGPGWTDLKNAEGQRRLDQPNDHVRIEIELALKRDIRVIPVLVDGASMPTEKELPDSLKPLSRRNAVTLSHHRFGPEVDELARALQRALGLQPKSTTTYTFAARETPTPSWIDFLFSFEGRISRKSFWLSGLAIAGCRLLGSGRAWCCVGKGRVRSTKEAMSNTLVNYIQRSYHSFLLANPLRCILSGFTTSAKEKDGCFGHF